MSKQVLINGEWPLILPDSSADEWIGNMKFHHNTWEMPRLLRLKQLIDEQLRIKKTANVLYIGAYKGDMAALLACWGAEVALVESTPAFWGLIKETWELNNLPKPPVMFSGLISNRTTGGNIVETLGTLSDWPTRIAEYIEGAVGFTHLAESRDDITFPEITIDQLVAQTGFVPDIVTMDIEGSELEACKGALDLITSQKAAWMLSVHPEFMFHNHGTYERELHDLLRNNGYKGAWIDYDHEHHWLYEVAK